MLGSGLEQCQREQRREGRSVLVDYFAEGGEGEERPDEREDDLDGRFCVAGRSESITEQGET